MARAPALFFHLELADAVVYKTTTAFVDFNFTFLFMNVGTLKLAWSYSLFTLSSHDQKRGQLWVVWYAPEAIKVI